jgi:hypothetical protein
MRQALHPATGAPSSASIISRHVSKLTGILFASIIGALHQSRRHQTRRILRQYRHLLARAPEREAGHSESDNGSL